MTDFPYPSIIKNQLENPAGIWAGFGIKLRS